jgi:hypothetical protein
LNDPHLLAPYVFAKNYVVVGCNAYAGNETGTGQFIILQKSTFTRRFVEKTCIDALRN